MTSLMQLRVLQRPDGGREIVVAGQSFLIREDKQEAAIPKELLEHLSLSDLPELIGVKPLGLTLSNGAASHMDCWLYGFRDGYASARIEIAECGGPSPWLLALREAVCKRQETQGDVEADEIYKFDDSVVFGFLLDLAENFPVPEAVRHITERLRGMESSSAAFAS